MRGIGKKRPVGSVDVSEQDPIKRRAWKRRLPLLVVAVVMTVGIGFAVPSALAVDNEGLFELDGNTANDPAVLGDDWSNFQSAGNAVSTTFVTDGVGGVNDTTYHGGGSQPGDDIPTWSWDCSESSLEGRHRPCLRIGL